LPGFHLLPDRLHPGRFGRHDGSTLSLPSAVVSLRKF